MDVLTPTHFDHTNKTAFAPEALASWVASSHRGQSLREQWWFPNLCALLGMPKTVARKAIRSPWSTVTLALSATVGAGCFCQLSVGRFRPLTVAHPPGRCAQHLGADDCQHDWLCDGGWRHGKNVCCTGQLARRRPTLLRDDYAVSLLCFSTGSMMKACWLYCLHVLCNVCHHLS